MSDGAAVGGLTVGIKGVLATLGTRLTSVGGGALDVPLPAGRLQGGGSVAVGSDGGVYVAKVQSIVKLDTAGQTVWERRASAPLRAVWTMGSGGDERVGAVLRDRKLSETWTPSGQSAAASGVFGDSFTPGSAGGLVATDEGRYVRVFGTRGNLVETVGSAGKDNDPSPSGAPAQFYQLGGAAQLPDGRLLVADTEHGLMLFSKGLLRGSLAPAEVDPEGLTQLAGPVVRDGAVYVATGPRFSDAQRVTRLSLAEVLTRTTRGQAGDDPRLGFGAGLTTNHVDGYVPPGGSLQVRAVFDGTWGRQRDVQLCYVVRDARALRRDPLQQRRDGGATRLSVQKLAGVRGGVRLRLPAGLAPGPYEVVARLVRGDRALSGTTLPFTVGARGQRLDIAALPPGADFGGPAPARGVALADELGTGAHRVQLDWQKLLPNGPGGAVDVSAYVKPLADAAAEAERRGVILDVQMAQGDPVEKALVADGTWEKRVQEVVAQLKDSVHVWEAWNEPNNTFGAAPKYVDEVLKPFHRAVKRADPSAKVVGGSTVGVSLPYWSQLVEAGALDALDVAAAHPYTGANRSWEEDGTIEQLKQLRALLQRDGKPVPLWDTESAWWSDGPFNTLAQADHSSRKMLWMAAIGIEEWAYFVPEGGFGDNGISFSAIENDDYVKPAALALMTTSAQLKGRPFLGTVDVGAPSAYAMRFGPRAGDPKSGQLLVAWTDGLALRTRLTPDANGRQVVRSNEFGSRRTITFAGPKTLVLDSDPAFLAMKGPGKLDIAPQETFGPDVAASAAGASATASSELPTNPAKAAIDGDAGSAGGGDLPGLPMWASADGDEVRTLTVTLAAPTKLDRVLVATHSLGSTITGLRDYDVEVQNAAGAPWKPVRRARGQFHHRQLLTQFPARTVSAIRVRVLGVNFSGYAGGPKPPFWPAGDEGHAIVAELRAYAPASRAP